MKYSVETIIDLPITTVVDLFDNPEYMKEWQKGFVSMELLEGRKGEVGSKSMLKYKMGNRDVEMIETLIHYDLPNYFETTFETKGMINRYICEFKAIGSNQTKWINHNEFRGTSLLMKLLTWIMPGAFKRQSKTYMEDFKKWAEQKK